MLKGTLDFETDPFKIDRIPAPFASCIYFGENDNLVIWSKKCAKKTFDEISKLPACELYAHNGGKFDFWFLLQWVENQDVKIINGRIAKIKIGKCTLIDSYLLIAEPLDRYQKTVINYEKMEREVRNSHKSEIIKYMVDDCKFLLELVNGFHEILGKKLTIGGAAMASAKAQGVDVIKQGKSHDEIFRRYYYGGRVEALKRGSIKFDKDCPGYLLDINSAYPFAMVHGHPHGKQYIRSKTLPKNRKDGAWFAVVVAISRGALPVRLKSGELKFPRDGKIRTYRATGWEINAGLETKTLEILEVRHVLRPKKKINFKKFVLYHYRERQAAKAKKDKLGDLVHKKAMNSGYGKLASNPEKFFDWVIAEPGLNVEEYEGGNGYEWYNDIQGQSLWRKPATEEAKEQGYYDVATGASITGFVRAMLWRALRSVSGAYYCDTDSIFCSEPGKAELSDKVLGTWKTEMRVKNLFIAGKKIYAAKGTEGEEKLACKGARLSYEEIKQLTLTGKMNWENIAPTFSISRGIFFVKRDLIT